MSLTHKHFEFRHSYPATLLSVDFEFGESLFVLIIID